MTKIIKAIALAGLSVISTSAYSGFRIQHYAPELSWMAQPPVEEAKLEAAIVAPRGLTCYLPSEDGFCTVPLFWLTNQDSPASLWRQLDGNRLKVASGFDGQVNVTARLNRNPQYEIIQGLNDGGKVLDAATVTALWDPVVAENLESQKGGSLEVENNGDCQILTGRAFCEVPISWSTQNVQTASLWMRTSEGLSLIYEGAKEAAMKVAAYDHASIYELREGKSSTGELLAAAMTKGHRVVVAGEILLPDGPACGLAPGQKTCDIRVAWKTNDDARLWIRELVKSSNAREGQVVMSIDAKGAIVDLRSGTSSIGEIIDRATLSTVPVDSIGTITQVDGTSCEIPYSGTTCNQRVRYGISEGNATLWSEAGQALVTGTDGEIDVQATEYGLAYHLRAGSSYENPILATYIAKGIKQTYRGSIKAATQDYCTFNYQGGSCTVEVDYEATDKASIWETETAERVSGGGKSGRVGLVVHDRTGEQETLANFDLRIHGNYSPKISDPILGSLQLRGIQPQHTGQLTATAGTSCNLLYSKSTCGINVQVVTTSPSVTLWNETTGVAAWHGNNGSSSFAMQVTEGAATYTLREGSAKTNRSFGSLTLTGVRPTYFAQLTMPSGDSCVTTESNSSCVLSFKLNSNTTTRIRYRDITSNPNATWQNYYNSLAANASFSFTASSITADRVYEFQVEQNASPYEALDNIVTTAKLNTQHSFELTSILPQPDSGIQCRAEWAANNISNCISSTPITWNTSAPTVTVCRRVIDEIYYRDCLNSTNKSTAFNNHWAVADKKHKLDFYEGNVNPRNEADAQTKKYRLLSSHEYFPARMLQPTEHQTYVDKDAYQCELPDRDQAACSAPISVTNIRPYHPIHQTQTGSGHNPYYYVAKKGSASPVVGPYTNTGNPAIQTSFAIYRNDEPEIFELRLRGGSSPSLSDPVIQTFTGNTYYRDVKGNIFARRAYSSTQSDGSPYITNSSNYPHYFSRTLSGSTYSQRAEPCLIMNHQDVCKAYLWSSVNSGSRAAVFIDGQFVGSFSSNIYYGDGTFHVNLPIGDHEIAIHDGATAAAINNKKIDSFMLEVKRPEYVGSLSPSQNDISLSYYGEQVQVRLNYSTNTRAYVYNKTAGRLIGEVSPNYGADEQFRVSSYFNDTLGSGEHVFELRTHQNASDPKNIVLATTTVRLTHAVQTMEIKEYNGTPYSQYLNGCPLSLAYKTCNIYYSYVNSFNSSSGISACAISPNGYRKAASLNGSTSYSNTSLAVNNTETAIHFYNGRSCPSNASNPEGYPLLKIHELTLYGRDNGVGISVQKHSGSDPGVFASETEPKTWVCHQKFQGDSCWFNYTITPNTPPISGQPANAYYAAFVSIGSVPGVYVKPSQLLAASNNTDLAYTRNYYTNGVGDAYLDVYACQRNDSSSYCNTTQYELIDSFKVVNYLPEYTASISTPNGNQCMAGFGQTNCPIKLDLTTTSWQATVFRDGVALETFGKSTPLSKSYNFPVKAKGTPTIITVRDGNSSTNRILATYEVFAETFDEGIFKFTDPITNNRLNQFCLKSHLTGVMENCDFNVNYSSDDSVKYLTSTGTIDKTEVSGNGYVAITGSITGYLPTFANHGGGSDYFSVYAYTDQAKTKLAAALNASYKYMIYSDNAFMQKGTTYVMEQDPSYSGNNCSNGFCGYWISNYGDTIYLKPSITIDDLTLTAPPSCSTTGSGWMRYPQFCGVIDFRTIYASASPGAIARPTIANRSEYAVKRLFYRRSSRLGTYEADWSDAVVTINGVARPLNMDGNWHYIDVNLSTSVDIVFSAINDSASGKNLGIDVFAEYYSK